MSSDFLTIVREIRGTGAPEAAYTDGIYYDLTIALTGINNAAGKYGHILEIYNDLTGPTSSYTDFVDKYNEFLLLYSEVLVNTGLVSQAALDTAAALLAAEGFRDEAEAFANVAIGIENRLHTLTTDTGLPGSMVVYDDVLNNITIPRGVKGEDGVTPVYAFTYNVVTGDLEYEVTNYIPLTDIVVEEW